MARRVALFVLGLFVLGAEAGRGQEYNVREEHEGQKDYSKEEEGKILPTKTFLTAWEITLICVLCVVLVFLLVFCCLYCYCFGCTMPDCSGCCDSCCRRASDKEDYTQVQLHRERKIGEIWRTNYAVEQQNNGRRYQV